MSNTEQLQRDLKLIKFSWTSDGSGDASETNDTELTGKIIEIVTVPGSGGSQPTDQYDLTITDNNSIDISHGNGANRSNASNEYITEANAGAVVNSKLTITVANAGDTKTGDVYIFVK